MTTVTNTVTDPSGTPVAKATVVVELVAADTPPAPGYTGSGTVIDRHETTAAADGTWSISLPGNSTLTPSGTYYRVSEYVPGSYVAWVSNISVPASGGPYALSTLLVTNPPSPSALGVATSRRINTTSPLSGGGDLSADLTLSVNAATVASAGVIQLAGDLSGTAAVPTVPGKQPLDSTLTALAALDGTTGLLVVTAADTFARRSLAAGSTRLVVSNVDGATGNPTVDLGSLTAADIPALDASKITTGIFVTPRVPEQETPNLYTGAWWSVPGIGASSTGSVPTLNQAYLAPFIPARDGTIAAIGIEIVGTDSGVVRLGIASSSAGKPGSWITDWGTVGEGSAAVVGISSLSQAVSGGTLYFLAAVPQSAVSTLTWRTRTSSDRHIPFAVSGAMPSSLGNGRNAYISSGWSGALSGAITVTASGVSTSPIFCVQLT